MKNRFLALLLVLALMMPGFAVADTNIEYGMNGPEVVNVQAWLDDYGFYTGPIHGDFDDATRSAVQAFQRMNGLAVTGYVNQSMLNLMMSETALTKFGTPLTIVPSTGGGSSSDDSDDSTGGTTGSTGSLSGSSLVFGMTGARIQDLQNILKSLGYYTGKIDGIFGNGVLNAVKQFQRRNGLAVDGKVGTLTMKALLSSDAIAKEDPNVNNTLQSGMSGEEVKELQRVLRETYYYAGTIDGIFGADVTRAVKWFQESAGLTVDGKVGPKTREALFNRTASIFNGGIPRRSLSAGSRGYDVFVLQQKLLSLNYLAIMPSGYYGEDTVSAVKAFQKANGLTADGKFGSVVRRYLWPTTVDSEEEQDKQNQGTLDDPYTERTLRLGNYGNDVANAQMRMKSAGYLLGKADGIFGPQTKKAVIALQKDYNLKQDGVIGAQTWAVIKTLSVSNAEPDVVDPEKPSVGANVTKLQNGSRGASVTKLQQQLITLGYLAEGEDDGKFGPKTRNALMQFQRDQKISVDGIAGIQTFVRLNEVLGVQWNVPQG